MEIYQIYQDGRYTVSLLWLILEIECHRLMASLQAPGQHKHQHHHKCHYFTEPQNTDTGQPYDYDGNAITICFQDRLRNLFFPILILIHTLKTLIPGVQIGGRTVAFATNFSAARLTF